MKHPEAVTIANSFFQEYLNLLFGNLGGSFSPMDWLEMDMSMSKTEMLILLLLEREAGLKISDIGRRLVMPLSTTTSIVDRLEQKKLVERTRSTEDRRVVIVQLTESGKKMCSMISKKVETLFQGVWQKISSNLTGEEIELLKKVFYKITRL